MLELHLIQQTLLAQQRMKSFHSTLALAPDLNSKVRISQEGNKLQTGIRGSLRMVEKGNSTRVGLLLAYLVLIKCSMKIQVYCYMVKKRIKSVLKESKQRTQLNIV